MSEDSKSETTAHILRVRELLYIVQNKLEQRGFKHDQSKLESPEKEGFDEVTGALRWLTYGSDEYKAQLDKLKLILAHHYAHNSHHPEHFQVLECNICFERFPSDYSKNCERCGNGQFTSRPDIGGMSLLDIMEMFCDWKAATERHADGSLAKSIEINAVRFQMESQLISIFRNTRKEMEW